MTDYRNHSRKMWDNSFIQELDSDGFRLWIYLTCNLHDSCSGIYELPARYIPFETGLPAEKCKELLAEFESSGKIRYQDNVMWVKSMRKHQTTTSIKMTICANSDVITLKDCAVKSEYLDWLKNAYPKAYAAYQERAELSKTREVDSEAFTASFKAFWKDCETRGTDLVDRDACLKIWERLAKAGNLPPTGHVLGLSSTPSTPRAYLECGKWE